jgi:NADH-quinone oxidoreductase subunit L
MRKMGGLRKYMPITFITMWIGTLALTGMPFFSGFYSKDTIIEAAAHHAHESIGHFNIAWYGYMAVLLGVFVTSFYSFRLLYLTFHGEERFRHADAHADAHSDAASHDNEHHDEDHGHHVVEPKESPLVVTIPLILLAIPSVIIGFLTIGPMLFGDFFTGAIQVNEAEGHLKAMSALGEEFQSAWSMALHGFLALPFWLAFAGFALATYSYLINPSFADRCRQWFALPIRILENKYGFDDLWIKGFAAGGLGLGRLASRLGDAGLIDGVFVKGSAWLVNRGALLLRRLQTGYLFHYAFAMILGLIVLLALLGRWHGHA